MLFKNILVPYDGSSHSKHAFKVSLDMAKKAKVSFRSEVIESHSTTKTIVSYSKSKKIDLIVMGAQGITGWDKFIMGSVSDGVVHRVKCPVLIVR